jgi:hypothetical protein
MSIVAGCVLHDRVVITADCRITCRYRGREDYFDNALKLRRIGPWSVLGFVGNDMDRASSMLGRLQNQAERRIRRNGIVQVPGRPPMASHPLRLARWLPRFLRASYGWEGTKAYLGFMHAYAIPHVPTIVHRTELDALLKAVAEEGTRNWVPEWLAELRRAAAESPSQSIAVGGSYSGHLQVMESPDFRPRFVGIFGFDAIGSGAAAATRGVSSPSYGNTIFAGGPFDGFAFDAAVDTFVKRAGIRTIGGMRPTYEISSRGVEAVATRSGMTGSIIAVTFDPHRGWLQRNETSGVEMPILPLSLALERISRRQGGRFIDATYNF